MNAIKSDARHQILVNEAKKQGGQLSLYNVKIEDIPAMAVAFAKKYGIKVKV